MRQRVERRKAKKVRRDENDKLVTKVEEMLLVGIMSDVVSDSLLQLVTYAVSDQKEEIVETVIEKEIASTEVGKKGSVTRDRGAFTDSKKGSVTRDRGASTGFTASLLDFTKKMKIGSIHWLKRKTHRAWITWRNTLGYSTKLQQTFNAAVLTVRLSQGWHTWKENIKMVKRNRGIMTQTIRRMRQQKVSLSLGKWRRVLAEIRVSDLASSVRENASPTFRSHPVLNYFQLWHVNSFVHKREIEAVWRGSASMRYKCLRNALYFWRLRVRERNSLHKRACRYEMILAHSSLMLLFNLWRSMLIGNSTKEATLHLVGTTRMKGFITWKINAKRRNRETGAIQTVLAKLQCSLKSAAYQTWKVVSSQMKICQNSIKQCLLRMRHRRLSAAYQTWKEITLEMKTTMYLVERCLLRMCHGRLSRVFATWRDITLQMKTTRNLLERCLLRMRNRRLSAAYQKWRVYSEMVWFEKDMIQRVLSISGKRALVAAFNTWQAPAQDRRHLMGIWKHFIVTSFNKKVAQAFRKWHVRMLDAVKELRFLEYGVLIYVKSLSFRSLKHWQSKPIGECKEVIGRAIAHSQGAIRKAAKDGFHSWLCLSGEMRLVTNSVQRGTALWDRHQKTIFYMKLIDCCQQKKQGTFHGYRSLVSFLCQVKSKTIRKWRDKARADIEAKELMVDAYVMLAETRLLQAIRQWQHVTYSTVRIQSLTVGLVYRLYKKVITKAFVMWRLVRLDVHKMHHSIYRVRIRAQASAFRTWNHKALRISQEQSVLAGALNRMVNRSLSMVFAAWLSSTTSSRTASELLAVAALILIRSNSFRALRKWRQVSEEQGLQIKCKSALDALAFSKIESARGMRVMVPSNYITVFLYNAYMRWHLGTKESQNKHQNISSAVNFWFKKQSSRAFIRWYDDNEANVHQISQQKKLHVWKLNKNLTIAWQQLHAEFQACLRVSHMLQRSISYLKKCSMYSACESWRLLVQQKMLEREARAQALKAFKGRCGAHGFFKKWRVVAREKKESKDLIEDAVVMLVETALLRGLQDWRSLSTVSYLKLSKVRGKLQDLNAKSLGGGLRVWRANTIGSKYMSSLITQAAFTWKWRSKRNLMSLWRGEACLGARAEQLLRVAMSSFKSNSVSRVFWTWHEDIISNNHEIRIIDGAICRMLCHHLFATWSSWRQNAKDGTRLLLRLENVFKRWKRSNISRTLRTWLCISKEMKLQQDVLHAGYSSFCDQGLTKAFQTWLIISSEMIKTSLLMSCAADILSKTNLYRAIQKLRASTVEERRLRAITLRSLKARCLSSSLKKWRLVIRVCERMLSTENAIMAWMHREKWWAFRNWCAVSKSGLDDRELYLDATVMLVECVMLNSVRTWRKALIAWHRMFRAGHRAMVHNRRREVSIYLRSWRVYSRTRNTNLKWTTHAIKWRTRTIRGQVFGVWREVARQGTFTENLLWRGTLKLHEAHLVHAWGMWKNMTILSKQTQEISSILPEVRGVWLMTRAISAWRSRSAYLSLESSGANRALGRYAVVHQGLALRSWSHRVRAEHEIRASPAYKTKKAFNTWLRYLQNTKARLLLWESTERHLNIEFNTDTMCRGWSHWLLGDEKKQNERALFLHAKLSRASLEHVTEAWVDQCPDHLIMRLSEVNAVRHWSLKETRNMLHTWHEVTSALNVASEEAPTLKYSVVREDNNWVSSNSVMEIPQASNPLFQADHGSMSLINTHATLNVADLVDSQLPVIRPSSKALDLLVPDIGEPLPGNADLLQTILLRGSKQTSSKKHGVDPVKEEVGDRWSSSHVAESSMLHLFPDAMASDTDIIELSSDSSTVAEMMKDTQENPKTSPLLHAVSLRREMKMSSLSSDYGPPVAKSHGHSKTLSSSVQLHQQFRRLQAEMEEEKKWSDSWSKSMLASG